MICSTKGRENTAILDIGVRLSLQVDRKSVGVHDSSNNIDCLLHAIAET